MHLEGEVVDDAMRVRLAAEADDEVVDVEDDVGHVRLSWRGCEGIYPLSFRDGAPGPDPESRDPGFAARPGMTASIASKPSLALTLLHAGIERIARGVADQVDAENGDCLLYTSPSPR